MKSASLNPSEKLVVNKLVIKDYVSKKCPYILLMELQNRGIVQLFKDSVDNQEKYRELVESEKEQEEFKVDDGDDDQFFNIVEAMKEYPELAKELKEHNNKRTRNPAEKLIEKYNDDQLISKLSRQFFINQYGEEHCKRCDVDDDGNTLYFQDEIVKNTERYLKDPNVQVLFEGQVDREESSLILRARFDVLIKDGKGHFDIIEVKGTNDVCEHPTKDKVPIREIDSKIKQKYFYDLAFQYYVYRKQYPIQINKLMYLHTNREYKLDVLCYPCHPNSDVVDPSFYPELKKLFSYKKELNLKGDVKKDIRTYFDDDETYKKTKYLTIEECLDEIRQIVKIGSATPLRRYECRKGPACQFIDLCFEDNVDNSNSIFKLTNWNQYGGHYTRMQNVMNRDKIFNISDIVPEPYGYTEIIEKDGETRRSNAYTQIQYEKGKFTKKYVIDMKRVKNILKRDYEDADYLLFFDFESFQHPIPLVKNLTPWKQVVSQYSLHICKKGYNLKDHDFKNGIGGGCKHYEYIADPEVLGYENPSVQLYQTLRYQMSDFGIQPDDNYRVIVFNRNFENTRLKEFGADFGSIPDKNLLQFVEKFRSKVVDLLDFFTDGAIYSRDFFGRGSLKVVQPTLRDDKQVQDFYKKFPFFDFYDSLDYHKGEKCLVYNGSICLDLYKSLIIRCHLGEQNKGTPTKQLLDEARAYCKIDTWGTVIIYDVIKNVYEGKLQLDAEII